MMNRMNRWLEESFLPVASKVASWRYMVAARNAFYSAVPFILIGSLFLIIAFIQIPGWDKVVEPYLGKILAASDLSLGILSMWVALTYGYSLAQEYELDPLVGGMASLMGFIVVAAPFKDGNLTGTYLGGTGIFTALIVGTFAVENYRFFMQRNITIKMPASVPPKVAASFGALLPLLFEMLVLSIITYWIGFDIPGFIMKLFVPLVSAGDSFLGIVLLFLLVAILFYLGIHGWAVVLGVVGPIELANIQANAAAHQAGQPIPHMLTESFDGAFISIGGATVAAALVILLLFFAKSKQLKQVGRLGFIPSLLVNVHEPIMFGVPTVLNPYFFFPVVFAYPIVAAITWIVMKLGLVTIPFIYAPWSTPEIIYPYVVTGGDLRAVLLMLFNLVVAMGLYYPFFRAYDLMLYKKEQEAAALEGTVEGVEAKPSLAPQA